MNKQLYGKKKIHLVQLIISSVLLVLSLAACSAAVETSKQRSRAVIDAGQIVPAEEIRVAEYLQYYDQHFPEPVEDSVGLDLRLGNYLMPEEGGMAWLQIGLQTRSEENEIVAPLNLALVIDCSGSMNDNDKMPYLKESMEIFLQSLDADDIVSIVGYNDKASVLLSAQKVGNRYWLQDVIDCIRPGGSTNLHAGLMEGFKQVDANYDIRRNNRVILLTDGIANRGVTDPDRIAADALSYNDRGIYLSTIGVGLDFNDSLLSRLARQGNSRYSFVDSTEEMDRIFREHVSSLTQRVASDVSVSVYPSVGVRLVGLTGLENVPSEGASISLWPLGTGDSTVVLAELQVQNVPGRTLQRNLARVKLQYYDEFAQKIVTQEQTISCEMVAGMSSYDPTWDLEILRNLTIQQTAEGMREIDQLVDLEQYNAAWRLAVDLEQKLNEVGRLTGDQQMYEDAALMQQYQQTLSNAIRYNEGRAPELDDYVNTSESRPYRGNQSTQIPDLPQVELE